MNREQWVVAKGAFAIDHFVPASVNPGLVTDYENLLYACTACNLTRGFQTIPNPLEHLLASTVEVNPNGVLVARTAPAQQIVEILHLNDREYVSRRSQMLALFDELSKRRPDLYRVWLGYPSDLPDVSRLRPPDGNDRPDGVEQSHFARRLRSELAEIY